MEGILQFVREQHEITKTIGLAVFAFGSISLLKRVARWFSK